MDYSLLLVIEQLKLPSFINNKDFHEKDFNEIRDFGPSINDENVQAY